MTFILSQSYTATVGYFLDIFYANYFWSIHMMARYYYTKACRFFEQNFFQNISHPFYIVLANKQHKLLIIKYCGGFLQNAMVVFAYSIKSFKSNHNTIYKNRSWWKILWFSWIDG